LVELLYVKVSIPLYRNDISQLYNDRLL